MFASQLHLFHKQTRVCCQYAARESSKLQQLLRHTATHASQLQLPELYKLGILFKDPNDILGLNQNVELIMSLSARYQQLRAQANPFQVSLLDAALLRSTSSSPSTAKSDVSGAASNSNATLHSAASSESTRVSAASAVPSVTAQDYFTAIMDLAKEVEAEHGRAAAQEARQAQKGHSDERSGLNGSGRGDAKGKRKGNQKKGGELASFTATPPTQHEHTSSNSSVPSLGETLGSTRAASLESHLNALEPLLRQLSPTDTARLIRTLAKLNYTNYEHTILLTRRGCEVASHLQRHDLCTLFFNLHKLHTRDSLVPIVNHILTHVQELTAEEVYLICQSIERQENNSTASQRLLSPLIAQALRKLPEATSSAYHRTLLVAMVRYHVQQPTTVQVILRDWVKRWKTTSSEKDVLVLLEAATTLAAPGKEPEGLMELVDRLTFLAPSMDLWNVDRVMDLLSTVPMHMSTDCMRILLTRLENEAGKLSVGQVRFVLHLLSSYPHAKGQVAVVSLAYAAAIRARAMDAETLESIVLSLAALQLFTDDFFSIAQVLQTQKGGIRSFQQAQMLFDCCTAEMAALPHGLGMLTSVICTLASTLNDEEMLYCRKALMRLGVTDREVLQQIFTKAKRAQRGAAKSISSSSRKRRGGYTDPMADLL